jgi:HK97 family phage major capsid protein
LELLYKIEAAIVNGTGAGMPLGITNAPATIVVPKQNGQAAGSVNSQNIGSMVSQFWANSYNSASSVFLYNQSLLPQLSTLTTIVGSGGSESKLWQWCTSNDDYDRLAGFPAMPSEYCGFSGTPGDIVLADFRRYALVVRERMRAEMSIHVLFISAQSTFRTVMRIGGAPIDRSPVIAAAGGSPPYSTSPFVILAQR